MDIGKAIRYYRKQCEYTQKELAKMIFVSERAIGNYEKGIRSPDTKTLEILAQALEIEIADFFEPIPDEIDWRHDNVDLSIKESRKRLLDEIFDVKPIKKSEKPKLNVNKNMDIRRYKMMMKREFENYDRIFFNENENEIATVIDGEVEYIYDKNIASNLLSYANNSDTFFDTILQRGNTFSIGGEFKNVPFIVNTTVCEEHDVHFNVQIGYLHFQILSPIVQIIRDWYMEKFNPKKVKYNLYSLPSLGKVSEENLFKHEFCRNEEMFSNRIFNCFSARDIKNLEQVMRLTKNELNAMEQLGTRSVYEILDFQEEMKKLLKQLT